MMKALERKTVVKQAVLLVATCLILVACNSDDAKRAWNSVVKKCAVGDLNGKTILYFGPSNNVGPGSVWRAGPEGGYRLRWSLQEMPGHEVFINPGNQFSCEGTSATKFGLKAAIGLTSQVTPASGSLANDFQKAKSIDVKATSLTWDMVKEGPFENYIKALPATAGVREDLGKGDRLVLYRALRVSGYSAVLEFNTSDAAELKAKYSGPLPKSVTGELSAGMSATWSADNKLTLSSTGDFYIAGELVPYTVSGFAAAKVSPFGKPIEIGTVRAIVREKDN